MFDDPIYNDFEDFLQGVKPSHEARRTPGILYRQGGDRDDWATPGSSNWVPVAVYIQAGSVRWHGAAATSGTVSENFTAPYYGEPLIFIQVRELNPQHSR